MSVKRRVAYKADTETFSTATLPELLRDRGGASDGEIQEEFEQWNLTIGSLPLTTSEYCFAHCWLISAKALWRQGEVNTALYQLKQVAKKLEF